MILPTHLAIRGAREAEAEIARGSAVLTDDPMVLTACGAIDVMWK